MSIISFVFMHKLDIGFSFVLLKEFIKGEEKEEVDKKILCIEIAAFLMATMPIFYVQLIFSALVLYFNSNIKLIVAAMLAKNMLSIMVPWLTMIDAAIRLFSNTSTNESKNEDLTLGYMLVLNYALLMFPRISVLHKVIALFGSGYVCSAVIKDSINNEFSIENILLLLSNISIAAAVASLAPGFMANILAVSGTLLSAHYYLKHS